MMRQYQLRSILAGQQLIKIGVPLNDTSNLRLGIAEDGESILGDKLIAFQVGNEPDQYALHNHRPQDYGPQDYSNDFGTVDAALRADPKVGNDNIAA